MLLETIQGDDKTFYFHIKNSSGTAYDLTGCYLYATVKKNYTDADVAAVISSTLTISTPATGIASWSVTATQTLNLLGQYKYDLQLKNLAGLISTLIVDEFIVKPHVTIRTS